MAFDQLDKLLAVTLGFALAHTWNQLQFIDGDGIGCSHGFERRVLEYNIGRQLEFWRCLLAHTLEDAEQFAINGAGAATHLIVLHCREVTVLGNHKWWRSLKKVPAALGNLEHSIVLDVAVYKSSYDALCDHGIQETWRLVLLTAKDVELVVKVGLHLVSGLTRHHIYHVVGFEFFFQLNNCLKGITQLGTCLYALARMQAVVAIVTVVFGILLAKIMK